MAGTAGKQVNPKASNGKIDEQLKTQLQRSGLRTTPQRLEVYAVISDILDHPTAEGVFIEAKKRMPEISMATVYNCLDVLVKSNLVRVVNLNRAATRYCPNMTEHSHFYCEICDQVYDIPYSVNTIRRGFLMPTGFTATHFEVAIQGTCGHCGEGGSLKRASH